MPWKKQRTFTCLYTFAGLQVCESDVYLIKTNGVEKMKIFTVLKLIVMLNCAFFLFPDIASAADANIFGSSSDAQAKQSLGAAFNRFAQFLAWMAMGVGLVSFFYGLVSSNGWIGNAEKGQKVMTTGVIIAVVGGAFEAVRSLVGWIIG